MRPHSMLLSLLISPGLLGIGRPAVGAQTGAVAHITRFGGKTTRVMAPPPAARPPSPNMKLHPGDTVDTGTNGSADLWIEKSRKQVSLDRDTIVQFDPITGKEFYPRGHSQHRGDGPSEVRSPDATIFDHTTEFDLRVDPVDGKTILTVLEGEAVIQNEKGVQRVEEGQQSVAEKGKPPTKPVVVADLPVPIELTPGLLPPLVLLETTFVSQDPRELARAAAEAERLQPPAAALLGKADVLHDRGQWAEALDTYDAAGKLAPPAGDPGWAARLAEHRALTLLDLGRLDDAEAAFQRAETLAGEDRGRRGTAQAGRALVTLARGDLTRARSEAETARTTLAAGPGPEGRRQKAEGSRTEPPLLPTADCLLPTGPEAPPAAFASLVLAVVEIRQADQEGGAQAQEDRAAAARALARALALDPRNAQAHAWNSFLLRDRGDLAAAEKEAAEAVKLAPYSAVCRQALAGVYALERKAREAVREARLAVKLNPLSPGAYTSLAYAELLQASVERQPERAAAAVRAAYQAVALDPKSDRAQYALGASLAEERRYRAAQRHLEQALELNPGLLEASSALARVLEAQGDHPRAIAVAQRGLTQTAQLSSAAAASAYAALGQVYRMQGKYGDAELQYQEALSRAPVNGLYQMEAAQVNLDRNDLADALSHALEAVHLLPESAEAHAVLGQVYDRQGDPEQAIREYREAISLDPENSLARFGLVTAFTSRTRDIGGSGIDQAREQAQALLRDPAVLRQVFERPGITSEFSGGAGAPGHEQQQYLHRGEFSHARVHDLTIASRFSDDGDRPNSSTNQRLLKTDVAIQATPTTQILAQVSAEKDSGGLPGPTTDPRLQAYGSDRENLYNFSLRQYLGGGTYLWLHQGLRSERITRKDPGQDTKLNSRVYQNNSDAAEGIGELRLDRRIGHHLLSYGIGYLRLDTQPYADARTTSNAAGIPASPSGEVRWDGFFRDVLQYLQDERRIGSRGSLIAGIQLLHTKEEVRRLTVKPSSRSEKDTPLPGNDRLPYLAATYRLDGRNLIRILGNKTVVRLSSALLSPSEAFIIGEPISLRYDDPTAIIPGSNVQGTNAGLETYELDYEHRSGAHTFSKAFLQYGLAHRYQMAPTNEQWLTPFTRVLLKVRLEVAGVRFEHQIHRYLAAFTRWSYWKVENRDETLPAGAAALGLQVPFAPRWRGLMGFNYVDRAGTKVSLAATFLGRRYTDASGLFGTNIDFGTSSFEPGNWRAIGPHTLVDLRIAKEPSVAMEYGLTITNLFNTTFPYVPAFPTRGRTWLLTLARRY